MPIRWLAEEAAAAATTAAAPTPAPVVVTGPLVTDGQIACLIVYVWSVTLYCYSLLLHWRQSKRLAQVKVHQSDADIESKDQAAAEKAPLVDGVTAAGVTSAISDTLPNKSMLEGTFECGLVKCMFFNEQAIYNAKHTLQCIVEFGSIMLWFFLCDRTDLLPQGEKEYSRDIFLFVFLVLLIVAGATSLQPVRTPLLLNRPQTEEWKGWMQVLFLLYHYFEAREAYNAIRIFIAGYVWMTGFGNFSYYYRTGDFGIGRFCQMMWRLNFLVFFCCIVLRNNYMLYYICPMHTLFTIFVYATLAIAPQLNKSSAWLLGKIVACLVFVVCVWDIKPVFYGVWSPVGWLVHYTDPRKPPGQDPMYEWFFRSGLDRYVWIYGMLCAYMHPVVSKMFNTIDKLPTAQCYGARALLMAGVAAVFAVYYTTIFTLPKAAYNQVHPYTSWIPLTLWILVRNLTPGMRTYSLRLLGWLGCITLETYLCQFHIWLHSDIPNGQPKYLLQLLPGYPMLNFAACTAMYIYISHRLFTLTNDLKDVAVPHDNNRMLTRNLLLLVAVGIAAWGLGFGVQHALMALP